MFKKIDWADMGITKHQWRKITHFRFADDIVLISDRPCEKNSQKTGICVTSTRIKINSSKTQFMTVKMLPLKVRRLIKSHPTNILAWNKNKPKHNQICEINWRIGLALDGTRKVKPRVQSRYLSQYVWNIKCSINVCFPFLCMKRKLWH